jgi:riboflavin transporter FmnP
MVLEQALNLLALDVVSASLFGLVLFIVMGVFLWIGAYMAQIKKRSFPRAFLAALAGTIISAIVFMIMGFTGYIALVVSILIQILVIKFVFSTEWRKSLITWVFSVIAQVIAVLVLVFVLF